MGSIFDILGPVMVGPSSSHTAGAARIGYTARQLFGESVKKAEVYLHGSFAATGKGHGTDRAIIAGLLGMKPDDLRIPVAFEEAKKAGMEFTIANKELKNAHPNTSRVIMENADGRRMVIQAYSIGGGRIRVSNLDGIEVDFSGESNTLIVRNQDRPGCITEVSAALSKEKINVATMQVFRHKRGGSAVMVVETDQPIPQNVVTELKKKDTELLIKSVVIREIHHRVKNNLQTIASLLRLQARRAHTDETKLVLRDCINRVTSIAVVHEFLSQQDSGKIDVAVAAQGIYEAIIASMADPNLKLQTSFKADNVLLPSDKATSIALVLNELLQNSLDHAFAGRNSGRLDVEFYKIPGSYCLKICDDGNGLPPGFVLDEQTSLGLKIIKTMVEADLRGTFTIEALKQGTCAVVTIPSELEGSE